LRKLWTITENLEEKLEWRGKVDEFRYKGVLSVVKEASKGLASVKEIYQDRPRRVKELRAEGKKVIGYVCLYPVLEMLTAADLIPYRLFGDMREPISRSDPYYPTVACPFIRSLLDIGLKGRYNFLDGVVMSHACEAAERLAPPWFAFVKESGAFSHFMDVPHTILRPDSQEYFRAIVGDFKDRLEAYTGKELTAERLKEAIKVHNQQRALVRELYELRKPDPPLISGTDILQVMIALMSLPVDEGNKLLEEVISEVKERPADSLSKKPGRLLVWGPVIDNTAFMAMVESLDAHVVMDDICVGSRAYFDDVQLTDDPLDGLAQHYLLDIKCSRILREVTGKSGLDYTGDLPDRFGYIGEYAKAWKANGVILQAMIYCDGHAYEAPQVKDYLDSIGLPSMYLEHTYTEAALAPLRTRVQGLIEITS